MEGLLKDQEKLVLMLGNSVKDSSQTAGSSNTGYHILIASMNTDLIASVNVDTGEVKTLINLKKKQGPVESPCLHPGPSMSG